MERREWLAILYREANLFLERHGRSGAGGELRPEELDDFEPELHAQAAQALRESEHLEAFIKYSLLRDPSPELWRGENRWESAVLAVAAACLAHDLKGVAAKIMAGELPRWPSANIRIEPAGAERQAEAPAGDGSAGGGKDAG
jgi:hypothetical protein